VTTADWTALAAIATAIMAIATFVLAVKTRSMARETKEVAQATRAMAEETKKVGEATLKEAQAVERQAEQVERQLVLSTDALRISVQPWLVWEPSFNVQTGGAPVVPTHGALYMQGTHPALEAREEDDSVVGWFTVRNVGNGLAILDMSNSNICPRNEQAVLEGFHPTVLSPVVAPGETVDIEFKIPAAYLFRSDRRLSDVRATTPLSAASRVCP
jgi:hypothetical protein